MNWLVKLLGGYTEEQYHFMFDELSSRYKNEWEKSTDLIIRYKKLRDIATGLASKYREEGEMKKILKLDERLSAKGETNE